MNEGAKVILLFGGLIVVTLGWPFFLMRKLKPKPPEKSEKPVRECGVTKTTDFSKPIGETEDEVRQYRKRFGL